MTIKELAVESVKPYHRNAKQHTNKQIHKISQSIQQFGFNQPIVVDKENVIVVGHGRFEAAKILGLKKVPVVVVDLTEEQAKAYRLADNKLNESTWDVDLVLEEIAGLDKSLLELTGFDENMKLSIGKDKKIEPEIEFTTELMEANNYVVFVFDNIIDFQFVEEQFGLKTVHALDSKKGYERSGVGRVLDGKKLIKLLNDNRNP